MTQIERSHQDRRSENRSDGRLTGLYIAALGFCLSCISLYHFEVLAPFLFAQKTKEAFVGMFMLWLFIGFGWILIYLINRQRKVLG